MNALRVLLIGEDAPNALAGSYKRAFEKLGLRVVHYCDRRGIENALPGGRLRGLRRYVQRLAVPVFNRNLRRDLGAQAADLVMVIKGQHILPETIAFLRESAGAPVVNYYPDDPFCARHTNRIGERSVFGEYDVCFTFQRHRVPDYEAEGARRVEYLPVAYDPTLHYPVAQTEPPRFDVTFVGALDRERAEWLEPLGRFRLALYGGGSGIAAARRGPLERAAFLPSVFGAELPRAFASGAITINILRWGNYDAHNMRSFEAPACGAFALTSRSRELGELFREGDEIVFFDDRRDLVEKVTYFLAHHEERQRIVQAGLRRIAPETYEARARSILDAVGLAGHAS